MKIDMCIALFSLVTAAVCRYLPALPLRSYIICSKNDGFPENFCGEETTVLTCFVAVVVVSAAAVVVVVVFVIIVVMSWMMQSSRGGLVYAAGLDQYNL